MPQAIVPVQMLSVAPTIPSSEPFQLKCVYGKERRT